MKFGLNVGILGLQLEHQKRQEIFPNGMQYVMQGYTHNECIFQYEFCANQHKNGILMQHVSEAASGVLGSTEWLTEISPLTIVVKFPCEVIIRLSHLVPLQILVAMNGTECARDNLMFALLNFKHFAEANAVHHHAVQESYLRLDSQKFKNMMANLHQKDPETWRMFKILNLPELYPSHLN